MPDSSHPAPRGRAPRAFASAVVSRLRGARPPAPAPVAPCEGEPRPRAVVPAPERTPSRAGPPRVPSLQSFRVAYVVRPGIHDAACMRYRGYNMIEALRLAGVEATHFDEEQLPERTAELLGYDLVVLVRRHLTPRIAGLLDAATVPVACDLDDYLFDESVIPFIEFFRAMPPEDARGGIGLWRDAVLRCRYYLGTTRHLVERAADAGRISFRVRNGLNLAQLELCRRAEAGRAADRTGVRLGYFSGTRTHQGDFRIVAPTVARLLEEFPETTLTVAGDFDLEEFPEFARFGGRVEGRPFVDWRLLPAEITRADINLVPLEVNVFTQGKSNLKYYEAAAVGVPTVATPSQAFAEAIAHGDNGYLADNAEEWYAALRRLITDPAERARMGEAARRDALANYGPNVVGREALAAYRRILTHHRRLLGAPDRLATVGVVVSDLTAVAQDRAPALVLAAELARLGHPVAVTAAGGAATADEAAAILAEQFGAPPLSVQLGGDIPCADVLLAADAGAARRLGRAAHRGRACAYLSAGGAAEAVPGIDTYVISTAGEPGGFTLPAWAAPGDGPGDAPTPDSLLVAADTDAPDAVWGEVAAAAGRLRALHPHARLTFAGLAAGRAAAAGLDGEMVPWLGGPQFAEAVARKPVCLVAGASVPPSWVYELTVRGCPVVVALADGAGSPGDAAGRAAPADAGLLVTAVESLLVDRIAVTAQLFASAAAVAALPKPAEVARAFLARLLPAEKRPVARPAGRAA